MTLDEKIAILQAAKRGETIQAKNGEFFWTVNGRWENVPDWEESTLRFNFDVYDYRIKPKNTIPIITRRGTKYEILVNNDGSMSFGCETVEKKDVDAIFALRKGGGQ